MYRYRKLSVLLLLGFVLAVGNVPFTHAVEGHGRVRLAHFVFNAPAVDMLVDSTPMATNVTPSEISGYGNLPSGTHQISVQSSNGASGVMVTASLSINVEADRDYAIALIGQTPDSSLHLLVIDETAALNGLDTVNEGAVFVFHNLQGVPAIDLSYDDTSL